MRSARDKLGVQMLTGPLEGCVLGADECKHHDLLEEVRTSLPRFLN